LNVSFVAQPIGITGREILLLLNPGKSKSLDESLFADFFFFLLSGSESLPRLRVQIALPCNIGWTIFGNVTRLEYSTLIALCLKIDAIHFSHQAKP
jgi:hypothetical protein